MDMKMFFSDEAKIIFKDAYEIFEKRRKYLGPDRRIFHNSINNKDDAEFYRALLDSTRPTAILLEGAYIPKKNHWSVITGSRIYNLYMDEFKDYTSISKIWEEEISYLKLCYYNPEVNNE